MKNNKQIFFKIAKVDAAKREVRGTMVAEEPDKDGEIFDYETSVGYVKAWSEGFDKATNGKSLGNVREMHGKSAAGKVIDIEFDDAAKTIAINTKIVDNDAWAKCDEGVYTGFSIGGTYIKTWKDGQYTRYTADLAEVSIVDNPCVPGALFTAVKADGTQEMRKFVSVLKPAKKKITAESLTKSLGYTGKLEKGLWSVGRLADMLAQLNSIRQDCEYEQSWEGDDSAVPADLKAAVKTLSQILVAMATEETAELTAEPGADVVPGTDVEVLEMAAGTGGRHSAAIQKLKKGFKNMMKKFTKMTDAELEKLTPEELKKYSKELGKHIEGLNKCHGDAMDAMTKMAGHLDAMTERDQDETDDDEKEGEDEDDKKEKARSSKLKKSLDARFEKSDAAIVELKSQNETIASALGNMTKAFAAFMGQPAPSSVAVSGIAIEKGADGVAAPAAKTAMTPEEAIKAAHALGKTRAI